MDELDRRILRVLATNSRTSGAALALATGTAESTVSLRLKRLQQDKVILSTRIDLDLMAIGMTVQALISVRLVSIVREDVENFRREAPNWPGVLALFHMAGADDFLLHVAARNSIELRDFVLEHLASHPAVANTETNLIFEHVVGSGLEEILR